MWGKCTSTTSTCSTPFRHAVCSPPFQVEGSRESHTELNVLKKGHGLTIQNQQSSDPPKIHTVEKSVMKFQFHATAEIIHCQHVPCKHLQPHSQSSSCRERSLARPHVPPASFPVLIMQGEEPGEVTCTSSLIPSPHHAGRGAWRGHMYLQPHSQSSTCRERSLVRLHVPLVSFSVLITTVVCMLMLEPGTKKATYL